MNLWRSDLDWGGSILEITDVFSGPACIPPFSITWLRISHSSCEIHTFLLSQIVPGLWTIVHHAPLGLIQSPNTNTPSTRHTTPSNPSILLWSWSTRDPKREFVEVIPLSLLTGGSAETHCSHQVYWTVCHLTVMLRCHSLLASGQRGIDILRYVHWIGSCIVTVLGQLGDW